MPDAGRRRVIVRAYRRAAPALLLALVLAACSAAATPSPQTVSPSAGGGAVTHTPPPTSARPLAGLGSARFGTADWRTDFARHSVGLDEITSGGPPRDGIPPLDAPRFVASPRPTAG